MDVAIVDVPWNGAWEGLEIAAMAEAHEVSAELPMYTESSTEWRQAGRVR